MRILLLEDDSGVRHILERLLGQLCSRFLGVDSLKDGKDAISKEEFDVLILDLNLTDSDKRKTLDAIQELRRNSNAPLIVLSGLPDDNLKEDALKSGADAFVSKQPPFSRISTAILMAVHAAILKHPKPHPNDSYLGHVQLLERLVHAA